MDGPSLISFTVGKIPQLVDDILEESGMDRGEVDLFLFHQATRKMLEQLQTRLDLDDEKLPIMLEHCGNTVSSTIPILIEGLRRTGRLTPGMNNMLVGFGVGWSWAGAMWRESWNDG